MFAMFELKTPRYVTNDLKSLLLDVNTREPCDEQLRISERLLKPIFFKFMARLTSEIRGSIIQSFCGPLFILEKFSEFCIYECSSVIWIICPGVA